MKADGSQRINDHDYSHRGGTAMSRVWLITGGTAALARQISDRGGSAAACESSKKAGQQGMRMIVGSQIKPGLCHVLGSRSTDAVERSTANRARRPSWSIAVTKRACTSPIPNTTSSCRAISGRHQYHGRKASPLGLRQPILPTAGRAVLSEPQFGQNGDRIEMGFG
jgi:hypothetical protein